MAARHHTAASIMVSTWKVRATDEALERQPRNRLRHDAARVVSLSASR